jgi:protein-export membrane protein SecD
MAKMKERVKVRLLVVLLLVVALVMGAIDYPKFVDAGIDGFNQAFNTNVPHIVDVPFHLGLDLQGGTHLVYEADTTAVPDEERGSAVEGVRDVIERRVNAFGVAEPVVQTNQANGRWRVIVELAGISEVEEAIAMIGQTPLLEFKEQNTVAPRELTADEQASMDAYNKTALETAELVFDKAEDGDDFAALVDEYSEDEFTKEFGGELGYLTNAEPTFAAMYQAISENENVASGEILDEVLEDTEGLNIVKINDIRDGEVEVRASHILICYQGAARCENETTREEAEQKINELKEEATTKNFEDLAVENSTEPAAATTGGDLNWFSRGMMVEAFETVVFPMEVGQISDVIETDFGFHIIHKTDERVAQEYSVSRILVKLQSELDILPPQDPWMNTELSGKQLKGAQVTFDQYTNEPQVSIDFDDEGKDLFADITGRNIGQPVAIYLDGSPISVPRVNEAITGGSAVISGSFDVVEAQLLAQRLNAGALPVPINLVSQQTVGASLGADSLAKSLFAGMIGMLLVILFMIGYYRLPGILAVIALLVYTAVLLFMFKLIPVTLTLAGVAGFILSLGMAVDANVLIFERMKEELTVGKPLSSAIDEGFKRAWTSIRDGNVSTLITCFILFWFGTSTIKGFAVTLGIGVMISMFSAIVITRLLLKSVNSPKMQNRSFLWLGMRNKTE